MGNSVSVGGGVGVDGTTVAVGGKGVGEGGTGVDVGGSGVSAGGTVEAAGWACPQPTTRVRAITIVAITACAVHFIFSTLLASDSAFVDHILLGCDCRVDQLDVLSEHPFAPTLLVRVIRIGKGLVQAVAFGNFLLVFTESPIWYQCSSVQGFQGLPAASCRSPAPRCETL